MLTRKDLQTLIFYTRVPYFCFLFTAWKHKDISITEDFAV